MKKGVCIGSKPRFLRKASPKFINARFRRTPSFFK
uniref:Ser1 n=1 Tax=Arundo donax TaxID=35708 RepID=A0A0A9R9A5_ARUDO